MEEVVIIPRQFDIITHEAMLDCAVQVEEICRFDDKWKIKGQWVNQGSVDTFLLGEKAEFEVPVNKLSEWLISEDPFVKCVRYGKWRRICEEESNATKNN